MKTLASATLSQCTRVTNDDRRRLTIHYGMTIVELTMQLQCDIGDSIVKQVLG